MPPKPERRPELIRPDPERWRVFLAIELPEAVRTALQAPIDGLRALGDSLRVNSVERIHLTLHFLGHLPVEDVDALQPAVKRAVGEEPRMRLVARGVGAFPNFNRAQVLWAGIAGEDVPRLTGLQRALGEALRGAGIVPENDERFHPHLTLARVRRPIRGQALAAWQRQWLEIEFGVIPVPAVSLIRSQLGSGPPRYSQLASFSLQ